MSAERVKVDINIPNDLVPLIEDLGLSKSIDENIKISIAIALFTSRTVSLARAAEIAEMALADFMFILKSKRIPWSDYTEDEFYLDEVAVRDIKKEIGENLNDYLLKI